MKKYGGGVGTKEDDEATIPVAGYAIRFEEEGGKSHNSRYGI